MGDDPVDFVETSKGLGTAKIIFEGSARVPKNVTVGGKPARMLPVKWRHRLGEWLIGERHRTFVVVREEQNSPAPDDEPVMGSQFPDDYESS
jgi:hypothetical protein